MGHGPVYLYPSAAGGGGPGRIFVRGRRARSGSAGRVCAGTGSLTKAPGPAVSGSCCLWLEFFCRRGPGGPSAHEGPHPGHASGRRIYISGRGRSPFSREGARKLEYFPPILYYV